MAGLHDELHALAGSLARLQPLLPAQHSTCADQQDASAGRQETDPGAGSSALQLEACAAGLSQLVQACPELPARQV